MEARLDLLRGDEGVHLREIGLRGETCRRLRIVRDHVFRMLRLANWTGLTSEDEGDYEQRAGQVAPECKEPVEQHLRKGETAVQHRNSRVLHPTVSRSLEGAKFVLLTMKDPVWRSAPVSRIMTKP